MKFWAATSLSPVDHYVPLARAAEAAGLYGIMMSDHIFQPRDQVSRYPYTVDGRPTWDVDGHWPDVWVTVAGMATVTTELQFGTNVYVAPARELFSVARQVGTAAVLSGNRVNLGVGAGWMKEEFDQTGQPFANRGRRLDEMIEALRVLWAGGWVEHHGEHYDFAPLRMDPAPTRPIPIWCGGHSPAALRRAARLCDGWVGNVYDDGDAEHYVDEVRRLRAAAGRSDDPFEIIIGLSTPLTPDVVERWAERGVTGLLWWSWRGKGADPTIRTDLRRKLDEVRRFGDEVVAPLRAG